ncbi:hypothetical protein EJ06DRAFT_534690 [Trichodelitschia bisporula]|uniref:Secreted protein n=1 Tax=Trichodelitschia bisporula TaxID=703511 RepID=A0A6G1HIN2_9PEZI|nr:hypothetical protein EJ06DRAFT_534690 [Trichodelitschia bisporula]
MHVTRTLLTLILATLGTTSPLARPDDGPSSHTHPPRHEPTPTAVLALVPRRAQDMPTMSHPPGHTGPMPRRQVSSTVAHPPGHTGMPM